MEEKIYNLIRERGPWFLKDTLFSKLVYIIVNNEY